MSSHEKAKGSGGKGGGWIEVGPGGRPVKPKKTSQKDGKPEMGYIMTIRQWDGKQGRVITTRK